MHPNGVDSMAISGLSFRNTLVGAWWATSILLCMKAVLSHFMAPISGGETFFPVWTSGCRLRAMTIARLLMSGCGLSHECVKNCCKSTCVKFGDIKPDRTGHTVSLMHVLAPPQKTFFIQ